MQNGIHSVTLTCDNVGDDAPPFTTEHAYVVTISLAFATSVGSNVQIPTASQTFKYKKIATSYDASGVYTVAPELMPSVKLERFNFPSTITVT